MMLWVYVTKYTNTNIVALRVNYNKISKKIHTFLIVENFVFSILVVKTVKPKRERFN
jgi:hypothetical protein